MKYVSYAILIICMCLLLLPLLIMISGSFTDIERFLASPPRLMLSAPTLENYITILTKSRLGIWTMNTLIIAGTNIILTLTTVIMAGYCFSRYPGKVVNAIYVAFIAAIIIPVTVLIIPMYEILRRLHLSGTRFAVVVPAVFYPLGLLLYTAYLNQISTEYDDSARCEGASDRVIITKLMLPMTAPILAALSAFLLMASLQSFLWPFLILQRDNVRTLMVGLTLRVYETGQFGDIALNPIGLKMTAGVILFVPLVLVYAALQKQFLTTANFGGLKE